MKRSDRSAARRAAPLGLATAAVAAGLVLLGPAPSYAIDGDDCESISTVETTSENEVTDFAEDGSPAQTLDLEAAQQRVRDLTGRTAGDGVTVAIVDSGVKAQPLLPSVITGDPVPGATATRELVSYQGTLLAGVVAAQADPESGAPVGVAPGATIFDQRVYDSAAGSDDELFAPSPEALAAGLEAIAPRVGPDGISIVVVGVITDDTAQLREAVEDVTGRGAIVVAATGPRPEEDSGAPGAVFRNGEDLADVSWPAGYAQDNPRVVAVTTTADSGTGEVLDPLAQFTLFSSATDVAAPTAGAVSVALNERYCSVTKPSTVVAAAVVGGVLALLETAFPDERPEQLVARLEATAAGSAFGDPAAPDTRAGRGVIQPLEALTRPLALSRDGELPLGGDTGQEVAPALLPEPAPDVLASTKDDAVWWGLLGGGLLVVLVLLRPVLSRRRG